MSPWLLMLVVFMFLPSGHSIRVKLPGSIGAVVDPAGLALLIPVDGSHDDTGVIDERGFVSRTRSSAVSG